MKQIYTCNEPLVHREFPATQRGLGVTVYGPYHHSALGDDCYDVEYQRLDIDASGFGCVAHAANARAEVIKDLSVIIGDLDTKIAELQAHHRRLFAERARLAQGADIGIAEPRPLQPGLFGCAE